MRDSIELSYDECRAHLESGEVGRVALSTPGGPRIIPVNYRVADSSIIFRTTPYSLLGAYARNAHLAFEVDRLDADQDGWSVVAVGRATMVVDLEELREIRSRWDPQPWPAGHRRMYFRMPWQELTGRSLGSIVAG